MGAADTDAARADAQRDGTDIDLDRSVDPRVVSVWRWYAALFSTPVIVAALIPVTISTAAGAPEAIALWIAWALLLTASVLYVWKYPAARYRHLRYRLDDVGITIRDGVFWRAWSALPRVRIQHTDVSQGPLQRRYGVADLKLYTAGSRYTRIVLPGLDHTVALGLRDELQRNADDDAV